MASDTFHIPDSEHTVSVSIIDTTCQVSIETDKVFVPRRPGHDYLTVPNYSFLIKHPVLGRTVLFDLGLRKDWWNSAPVVWNILQEGQSHLSVRKDIREILQDSGVPITTIDTIVWSHWHIDHVGDPSLFDTNVKLVVGPGFKEHILPPYPPNKGSMVLQSDFEGRELEELSFTENSLKIGRFNAIDYFGDGSFYFLDAPGHSIGHIAALARVKSAPDSFILMAGDGCLHGGQLRPSQCLPLPLAIPSQALLLTPDLPSYDSALKGLRAKGDMRTPFYSAARNGVSYNADDANTTFRCLQEADGRDDIFIVFSHDDALLDIVEFFPSTANDFMQKGWVKKSKWVFLRDFIKSKTDADFVEH
jgi:glyoxylase-like metal-dependent hydrolase (beta-lactamase superfamily II)